MLLIWVNLTMNYMRVYPVWGKRSLTYRITACNSKVNKPENVRYTMNKVFHVTRASIFLILASFASTAMSATVNSELGGASLDGAWGFGCSEPDRDEPDELYDEMEFLIYQGNKVESRLYLYASANGS
jgi:hypothetical protein